MKTYTIKPNELEAIALAASTEEARYYLNGVYIEPNESGTVALIATDGHRMASLRLVKENQTKDGFIFGNDDIKKILGSVKAESKTISKSLRHLLAIRIEKTGVELSVTYVLLDNEGNLKRVCGSFITKEIDGTFPDYRRVIPAADDAKADADLSFNVIYVSDFGKMASLIARTKTQQIAIKSSGRHCPILITLPHNNEFVGVLMPMRV